MDDEQMIEPAPEPKAESTDINQVTEPAHIPESKPTLAPNPIPEPPMVIDTPPSPPVVSKISAIEPMPEVTPIPVKPEIPPTPTLKEPSSPVPVPTDIPAIAIRKETKKVSFELLSLFSWRAIESDFRTIC